MIRLDRLEATAKKLSNATGQRCIAAQADVRSPEQLKAAVAKTIETFGRIDFVICGAAGNFLAPISGLSENAFRTVIEIDTVSKAVYLMGRAGGSNDFGWNLSLERSTPSKRRYPILVNRRARTFMSALCCIDRVRNFINSQHISLIGLYRF